MDSAVACGQPRQCMPNSIKICAVPRLRLSTSPMDICLVTVIWKFLLVLVALRGPVAGRGYLTIGGGGCQCGARGPGKIRAGKSPPPVVYCAGGIFEGRKESPCPTNPMYMKSRWICARWILPD